MAITHKLTTTQIVAIILTTFITTLSLSHFASHKTCQSVSITHKVPDLPTLRPIIRTFQELRKLEDLSYDADKNWATTLSTPKGGFLWMKYNESINEAWGVSMFHAIHCLTLIRNIVQASANVSGLHESIKDGHADHIPAGHPQMDLTHVGHCFSYISQVRYLPATSFKQKNVRNSKLIKILHGSSISCAQRTKQSNLRGRYLIMMGIWLMAELMVRVIRINAVILPSCGKLL